MAKEEVFEKPLHPYTLTLLSSIPALEHVFPQIVSMKINPLGEPPSPSNPPRGCRFHTRCPFAREICWMREPVLEHVEGNHYVACHLWREIGLRG